MRLSPRVLLPLVGLLVLAALASVGRTAGADPRARQPFDAAGARYRLDAASAKRDGARLLSPSQRRAGFHFAAGTAPSDEQLFLAAVAGARPRRDG